MKQLEFEKLLIKWQMGMISTSEFHNELQADNKRLREYVKHKDDCVSIGCHADTFGELVPNKGGCTCGLDKALQQGEK